jgi:hypothetical protein
MAEDKPLLHARRPAGRPRKYGHVPGTSDAGGFGRSGPEGRPLASKAIVSLPPRLLDVHRLAAYLSVPEATVYDLAARGVLRRVRVPMPDGSDLRKLLFDRVDVDRMIDGWKD